MIEAGAKMTQMENRIVLARFSEATFVGPVGAYFLHLKTYTQNGFGGSLKSKWFPDLRKWSERNIWIRKLALNPQADPDLPAQPYHHQ